MNQPRHDLSLFYAHAEDHHRTELEALGLPASPRPGFVLPLQDQPLCAHMRIVDYLYDVEP
jgi:hypothetical protein